ncbi:MAG: 16S rRNA (adenine(1518)-N(6)/adenine(1519)-N(6))-dimethyltransferase RsmA [Patescibacteria group bacterium]|nr:16S rRNA (adenine(1518)-N(6)/adenine(1519)-N(6))-dimethyltransferase RsmA [bacterium]MDZ4241064.1 16S rRNA (adenine(1518)-N(6)/adenine(1519)-N(6))-dimethyltransferase RsmA [Patescibacteria group bacterium]
MNSGQPLGQHFLRSAKALADIVSAASLTPSDTVLEIGPGEGVLTKELLAHAGKVIAIEKDPVLVEFLKSRFGNEIGTDKLLVIEKDIRDFFPEKYGLKKGKYKLVANIPYYITGEILRKFVGGETPPSHAVLLVQKEVAERIVEKDGKGSLLSISVRAFGEPKKMAVVKNTAFSPQPKVDSAILSIENISDKFFDDISQETFFETVKIGFSQKRKQLKNNLNKKFGESAVSGTFNTCSIPEKVRAEKLSLSQWKCLARELNKASSHN